MIKIDYTKYLAVLLFSFVTSFAFAQVEIKNTVLEFGFEGPIENASIYIQETAIGTVSNADGNFAFKVPAEHVKDTLVVSSIGYSTFKIAIPDYKKEDSIYLEQEVASLDEVTIESDPRPKTGNDIMLKALSRLEITMPDSSYVQKGFLRHKERNKNEFKWLIESAITVYDSGYCVPSKNHLKINVDQVRKSYDLRNVDSLFTHYAYLKNKTRVPLKSKNLKRDTIKTASLVKSIKWNDTRVNGLHNIFQGKLNLFRNTKDKKALFGNNILQNHQFKLDTILVDSGRKLYKLEISKGKSFVGLSTKGIYNEGYHPKGWVYIYYDNYAIKKLEYDLVPASKEQKTRSKLLLNSTVNHKLVINYKEFQDKMYPNYIYYETPKLVNVGAKTKKKLTAEEKLRYNEERFYYTVQEILFSEVIIEDDKVNATLEQDWDADIFSAKPYDKTFWESYNVLLESEEDEKLIRDLSKRASLFKE